MATKAADLVAVEATASARDALRAATPISCIVGIVIWFMQ